MLQKNSSRKRGCVSDEDAKRVAKHLLSARKAVELSSSQLEKSGQEAAPLAGSMYAYRCRSTQEKGMRLKKASCSRQATTRDVMLSPAKSMLMNKTKKHYQRRRSNHLFQTHAFFVRSRTERVGGLVMTLPLRMDICIRRERHIGISRVCHQRSAMKQ